jgi:hypothetical protein
MAGSLPNCQSVDLLGYKCAQNLLLIRNKRFGITINSAQLEKNQNLEKISKIL